jgi:hypothetical protein
MFNVGGKRKFRWSAPITEKSATGHAQQRGVVVTEPGGSRRLLDNPACRRWCSAASVVGRVGMFVRPAAGVTQACHKPTESSIAARKPFCLRSICDGWRNQVSHRAALLHHQRNEPAWLCTNNGITWRSQLISQTGLNIIARRVDRHAGTWSVPGPVLQPLVIPCPC